MNDLSPRVPLMTYLMRVPSLAASSPPPGAAVEQPVARAITVAAAAKIANDLRFMRLLAVVGGCAVVGGQLAGSALLGEHGEDRDGLDLLGAHVVPDEAAGAAQARLGGVGHLVGDDPVE